MPQQRNILCISNPSWEGDLANTIVELMSVAAQRHRILYVDYQFTIKDLIYTFLGKAQAPWRRMLGLQPQLRTLELPGGHSVNVLTPPTILSVNFLSDGPLYRRLLKYNSAVVARSIKRAIRELNMQDNLLLIDAFSPAMGLYNIGRFNESLHIYHCYDEIGAAEWFGEHGARLELEYMPQTHATICTSRGLYHNKKPYNKQTFLVQNGVNFERFHRGFNPSNLAERQKVIGYIGTIDDRLDYPLLEKLFITYPDWSFHFAGRCNYEAGERILRQYSNVKMLGAMPVDELPKILSTFHAGLIPFVENDFTRGIYPLKINEYLAAGLPVVLTRFSDMSEFEHIASICDSHEAFSGALACEVEADSELRRRERVAVAKANSWQGRWQEIESIIRHLEKQQETTPSGHPSTTG